LFALAAAWAPAPAAASLAPVRNGVIDACFGPFDGEELHLARAHKRCPRSESPLAWNQLGRPGKNGSDHRPDENWTFELSLDGSDGSGGTGDGSSFWSWIGGAVPALANVLLLFGLGMLALSIALVPIGWLLARPLKWRLLWRNPVFRWFGPALQIQPFEDSAMTSRLGTSFALLTQARVGGGHEGGMHLYLVTGEESPGAALADLQGVPQTQALAAALSLLRLTWRRRRLIVTGSLMPIDADGTAAVAVSLRRNSKFVNNAEFWPSEPRIANMTATTSNRVLAVAAAGWIEHIVVDETPGPQARELLLSHDPRSWALFRAGAELNRISYRQEAADHYERALAIDGNNIGALVDLAHLRRLCNYFEGAQALASRAIELIKKRNGMYGKWRDDDDPNWYRGQIVLATVHAEWAKDLRSKGDQAKADLLRAKAYKRAVDTAREAMDARDRLEHIVGADRLEKAAELGAPIGWWARREARKRAQAEGRSFDRDRAVELYVLLGTTFVPGALLLVLSNGPNAAGPLPVGE
jgi:tetratricopeptide (TPR) repeat protein